MQTKTKYVLIGLGAVALGTGVYFYIRQQKKSKGDQKDFEDQVTKGNVPITTTKVSTNRKPPQRVQSSYLIQPGSSNKYVTNLQLALISKYGKSILPKFGADGHFGSETVNALKSKGLPTRFDNVSYGMIMATLGLQSKAKDDDDVLSKNNPSSIANDLHRGIAKRDGAIALPALRRIRDVKHYSEVSKKFKKRKIGWVRKTIVTGLMDAFKLKSNRKKMNAQFHRIGLKFDGSKWSLSGILGAIDQLVTTSTALVWNELGKTIEVPANTILGEYLDANDGVTEFETIDGRRLFVRTDQIQYKP